MRHPNIVFVFGDQHRYDAVGASGNPVVRTPAMDRLAAEGMNCRGAISSHPLCSPYRALLLTGRYGWKHGVIDNEYRMWDVPTAAHMLGRAGYATFYVGKWHLGPEPYPAPKRHGFDILNAQNAGTPFWNGKHWENDLREVQLSGWTSTAATDVAIDYIRRHVAASPDRPLALFLSWQPPHWPYAQFPPQFDTYDPATVPLSANVPEEMEPFARKEIALYYANVTALDQELGKIINAVDDAGVGSETIICYSSDHGDHLSSHGYVKPWKFWAHPHKRASKATPYEESVHVPFLIRYPGVVPAGSVSDGLFGTVDIMPSLFGLAGLTFDNKDGKLDGLDLSAAFRGDESAWRDSVYMMNMGLLWPFRDPTIGCWRGVRTRRHTYARWIEGDQGPLLFDREHDPEELNNLVDDPAHRATAEAMEKLLREHMTASNDPFETGARNPRSGELELGQEYASEKWRTFVPPADHERVAKDPVARAGRSDDRRQGALQVNSYYEWARYLPVIRREDVVAGMPAFAVSLSGMEGARAGRCVENRLKYIIDHPLMLGGYREKNIAFPWKPAVSFADSSWEGDIGFAWQGEHIGKWLHAASVLAQSTRDEALAGRVHAAADELCSYLDADGYLGTYDAASRFTAADGPHSRLSWDVWTHRYHIYGLIAAYRAFGREAWLAAAVAMGDLLRSVFGPEGNKNLAYEGTRRGLSALTLLESVVMLYEVTGEPRFLDFAIYLLYESSESRTRVLSSLIDGRGVCAVGDGKAYQLMSVLLGVVDLARHVEDPDLLYAAVTAWKEISAEHLHITGGPWSRRWKPTANVECFAPASMWSPFETVELCSTITWMQLSLSLFRLTGETSYFDAFEKSLLNHFAASTTADGASGSYFTHPNGSTFGFNRKLHCCNSSAPRGWALAVTHAYGVREGGITVNAHAPGELEYRHPQAGVVRIAQSAGLIPGDPRLPGGDADVHRVTLRLTCERPATFPLFVRIPGWTTGGSVQVAGEESRRAESPGATPGWARLERAWRSAQEITVSLPVAVTRHLAAWNGMALCAYTRGPFVLASAGDEQAERVPPEDHGAAALTPFADPASAGRPVAVWFRC